MKCVRNIEIPVRWWMRRGRPDSRLPSVLTLPSVSSCPDPRLVQIGPRTLSPVLLASSLLYRREVGSVADSKCRASFSAPVTRGIRSAFHPFCTGVWQCVPCSLQTHFHTLLGMSNSLCHLALIGGHCSASINAATIWSPAIGSQVQTWSCVSPIKW